MNTVTAIVLVSVLFVLLLLSAFFSASETAFTSLSPVRVRSLASAKKSAKLVLKMSENYNRLLSTLLIGNNIVNIASASIATIVFTCSDIPLNHAEEHRKGTTRRICIFRSENTVRLSDTLHSAEYNFRRLEKTRQQSFQTE